MGKILKYWPKEEIIRALQALPKDKPINKKTIIEYSKQGLICNSSTIPAKFGSLKLACDIAGVRCDALYGKEKIKHMTKLNIKWTKESLTKLLKYSYKKYGIMTPTNFVLKLNKDNNADIRNSINKHFGSLHNAFKELQLDYNNHYWTNDRIIKTLHKLNKKYGPLYKAQLHDFQKKKLLCMPKLVVERFGSVDNAARIAGFRFQEPQDVGHLSNGRLGYTETEILDSYEKIYGIKIIRQYRLNIKGTIFFVDGYDKENNVVYEVDEKGHMYDKQKLLDIIKDEKIINKLNCQIIRIRLYKELGE